MHVHLRFGRGTVPLELSDTLDVTVVRKQAMAVADEPSEVVEAALAQPVGSPALEVVARGRRNACILVCDQTRPVPNGVVLPPLVRRLIDGGIAPEDITVLIATGLHRPCDEDEIREVIGDPWVLATVRVENHFARDDAAHVAVGRTTAGTEVKLDRRFVEADVRVAIGLVEPHFMAGFSGGRKLIAPGVAHRDTIGVLHGHRIMSHPRATSLLLDGNPLHDEQLEIVEMVGGALAVNTVQDEDRNLAYVSFGDIVASHLAAVAFVRDHVRVATGRQYATVVTSGAGYPLDQTYYQVVKGIVTPLDVLAPGGTLIVAGHCGEGLGSDEFAAAQRRLIDAGSAAFLDELAGRERAGIDEWQTQMLTRALSKGRVVLYAPALSAADRALTAVESAPSLQAALDDAVSRAGSNDVLVIPEGPYIVPVVG